MSAAVIIEAAINGGTPKARNPNVPRTPAEVAEDGLRCFAAGAAIVHNHNDEPVVGGASGVHRPEPYIEAWRAILREKPDALLYPTMASGGPHTTIEERYAHIPALARAAVCRIGLVDPGSVNVGPMDAAGLPAGAGTYLNTFSDANHMFETCAELGLAPSVSIFEPGFLRVALAYERAGRMPEGALIKLYFGAYNWGLPPTRPSLDAYVAMLEGTHLPWSVAVLGGDLLATPLAEYALELGGHLRVGLEDYGGPMQPSNVELIERAVALCQRKGRTVATAAEAAVLLAMPGA
ncbi:MAG: 3-keto-5-aminohexanoate cleavage protein [Dehalococcoidia bacterium]|uniref:3-keto-5-aminohexanoate cleavage protein n=1 Tax=Candidatus Amarobacter glycogenicus TaxID=3140699 RepID=UPI002A1267C5|nr:3-keto-5-aminohexanoate cleavage protein [Dehalococcoidia bacterium]MBK6562570.1 3-keto-5-aminohexanoate cleavage protein [Dehalococcoidia bacterium]MBK7127612.1 3-keto-5-aminohexanoate cleavage protein [Dehalococcoidia bacterium]MBK7330050.1 3-keto-5-aminohexanoate cleavage protein [Dehalococcoidia bacterium]MBK8560759.1 3-keto-5-aminohexanoate cleavage protein [Dehalococcoidia bacterium]